MGGSKANVVVWYTVPWGVNSAILRMIIKLVKIIITLMLPNKNVMKIYYSSKDKWSINKNSMNGGL